MTAKRPILVLALMLAAMCLCRAQGFPKINYTEPEKEDNRRTNFDIIGKMNGSFLVYKSTRGDAAVSLYDDDMKLKKRVQLDFIPDQVINVDFVTFPDYFYLVYEFQKKNVVYCMAAKLDGNGQKLMPPVELDTTHIGWAASNKIYSIINSEDKQRIMLFKINNKNTRVFTFTTLLYNANLELLARNRMGIPMEERNDFFTDFLLSNQGDFIFGKYLRLNSGEFISKLSMVVKYPDSSEFSIRDAGIGPRILDEIKLKVDNHNRRTLVNAFYYKQKKGNIEGIYSMVWDQGANAKVKESSVAFSEELRANAKGTDGSLKSAFDDYFIKHIISRKDGGYLVISESEYTTSRNGPFNRWDYFGNGPWGVSPYGYNYYSPYNSFYSPFYGRYGYPYGGNVTRYHAENILVINFDQEGKIEWSNVIAKSQFDDESEGSVSFQLMNTGADLHFLFNLFERRTLMLNDRIIDPNGKISLNPTLKNLDKGYDFMPRYGKQVSAWQMLVPCWYRNYLCFAKIEF